MERALLRTLSAGNNRFSIFSQLPEEGSFARSVTCVAVFRSRELPTREGPGVNRHPLCAGTPDWLVVVIAPGCWDCLGLAWFGQPRGETARYFLLTKGLRP